MGMAELKIHRQCQEACMNYIIRYETTILETLKKKIARGEEEGILNVCALFLSAKGKEEGQYGRSRRATFLNRLQGSQGFTSTHYQE
jgi:hypothetical protein